MYWTDIDTDKIQRANLDGSTIEDLVTSADGLGSPSGIALNLFAGKMYWTDDGADRIQRANLDGSTIEDLVTSADGLIGPSAIALGVRREGEGEEEGEIEGNGEGEGGNMIAANEE